MTDSLHPQVAAMYVRAYHEDSEYAYKSESDVSDSESEGDISDTEEPVIRPAAFSSEANDLDIDTISSRSPNRKAIAKLQGKDPDLIEQARKSKKYNHIFRN